MSNETQIRLLVAVLHLIKQRKALENELHRNTIETLLSITFNNAT
ncbi:hypothetical protein GCM10007169_10150 [Shewanella fodinae]|nr:hypothetical protein GCM10007169_10150 [Shewanella fodinae]